MGSAVTHGDWIWKAGEDFARQVDTSLKTKGKRKASTPRSHPPSCLTPACPAQLLPRWSRVLGVSQLPECPSSEVSLSTEQGSPWGHRGSSPAGQAGVVSTQAHVSTELFNLGTTPSNSSLAAGSG